jgi:hypothetical protein
MIGSTSCRDHPIFPITDTGRAFGDIFRLSDLGHSVSLTEAGTHDSQLPAKRMKANVAKSMGLASARRSLPSAGKAYAALCLP